MHGNHLVLRCPQGCLKIVQTDRKDGRWELAPSPKGAHHERTVATIGVETHPLHVSDPNQRDPVERQVISDNLDRCPFTSETDHEALQPVSTRDTADDGDQFGVLMGERQPGAD